MKMFGILSILLFFVWSIQSNAVTCRSMLSNSGQLNQGDPISRSILMAPSYSSESGGVYKFKTKDSQSTVEYRVIQNSTDLEKLIDSLDTASEKAESENLKELEGRVWGAGTSNELVFGEGGALLWSKEGFSKWASEYTQYVSQSEVRTLNLAFDLKLSTNLPKWLTLAMNYQLKTQAEAHGAKSDVEQFLSMQQLGVQQESVQLPASLSSLGFSLDFTPGNSETILTVFEEPVVIDPNGDNMMNYLQIRSAGRRAYNEHRRRAFDGAVVTLMPLHFDYEYALELGFDPLESEESWPRVFVIGDTRNKDVWTYRSVYRVPVIEARLELLKALGDRYLNQLDDVAFKNLIVVLAAYPELLSSPLMWPSIEIPHRGLDTTPEMGMIESKFYFLNYSGFEDDTFLKLIMDKQFVEEGFARETSHFYMEVDRLNPEFIDIGLFSESESQTLEASIREEWQEFAETYGLKNKFLAIVKMDSDRRRLSIEIESKVDSSPSETLRVLSAFFDYVRSDREYVEDRDAIIKALKAGA